MCVCNVHGGPSSWFFKTRNSQHCCNLFGCLQNPLVLHSGHSWMSKASSRCSLKVLTWPRTFLASMLPATAWMKILVSGGVLFLHTRILHSPHHFLYVLSVYLYLLMDSVVTYILIHWFIFLAFFHAVCCKSCNQSLFLTVDQLLALVFHSPSLLFSCSYYVSSLFFYSMFCLV